MAMNFNHRIEYKRSLTEFQHWMQISYCKIKQAQSEFGERSRFFPVKSTYACRKETEGYSGLNTTRVRKEKGFYVNRIWQMYDFICK